MVVTRRQRAAEQYSNTTCGGEASNGAPFIAGIGQFAKIFAMLFNTNKLVMTIYSAPEQDLLSPAIGAFQYLGVMYLLHTARCYGALTGTRDP